MDTPGCPERVGGPPEGPGRGVGLFLRSETHRGTFREVWNGSGDHQGCPGQIGGPSLSSETGWQNLPKVRDGSGDIVVGPRRVGGA